MNLKKFKKGDVETEKIAKIVFWILFFLLLLGIFYAIKKFLFKT